MKNKREVLKTPIKVLLVSGLVIVLLGLGAFSVMTVGALPGNNSDITLEKATDIALKDAAVDKSEAVILRGKLDRDAGIYKYDIEFMVGNIEYDYEIDAFTGAIIERDVDRDDDFDK